MTILLDLDHPKTCLYLFQIWSNQYLAACTNLIIIHLKRASAILKKGRVIHYSSQVLQ